MYILLVGYPPFWNENQKKLYDSISEGKYEFPAPEWNSVTEIAKKLITRMLDIDPNTRITAQETLNDSWISKREKVASKLNRQETIEGLKKFNARRRFKGAVFTTMFSRQFDPKIFYKNTEKIKENIEPGAAASTSNSKVFGNNDTNSNYSLKSEIITLTQQLLDASVNDDVEIFSNLRDLHCTSFKEESVKKLKSPQTSIVEPKVHLIGENGACICYVKITQYLNDENVCCTDESRETRVWKNFDKQWKCIHVHSS